MDKMDIFSRNEMFWGEDAQKKLAESHVAVFGLGGVGGFCAEALARAGVGKLTIVDFDTVSESNINRQVIALTSTVGKSKVELFNTRLKDINPDLIINPIDDFYNQKLNEQLIDLNIDFVADAIDSMRSKIDLLEFAYVNKIPVITSMGAGNRVNPEELYISDISEIKNKNAPFVSSVLYQLKKRGIESGITSVSSLEKPYCLEKISIVENVSTLSGENIEFKKVIPSSTPFVASASGLFMASYIVRKIIS